jgi:hypothetical protein
MSLPQNHRCSMSVKNAADGKKALSLVVSISTAPSTKQLVPLTSTSPVVTNNDASCITHQSTSLIERVGYRELLNYNGRRIQALNTFRTLQSR